jgi:intron-binding protein aquarius
MTRNQNAGDENELHLAWPKYQPTKRDGGEKEIFALVRMINEKFHERLPAWEILASKPEQFPYFFTNILHLVLEKELPFSNQIELITFLDNCFNSLEVEFVRQEVGKLCSLPIWMNLIPVSK